MTDRPDSFAPAGDYPVSSARSWLRRRLGRRVWFTLTAVFFGCLVAGIALLIAGQGFPGFILVIVAVALAVLVMIAMAAGVAIAALLMIWSALTGFQIRKPADLAAIPADIAPVARRVEQVRQDLASAARQPTLIGLGIGAAAAIIIGWMILRNPAPAYWVLPIVLLLPLVGAAMAGVQTQSAFVARFKTDLLPPLLARYGSFTSVAPDAQPDLASAQRSGVLWRHDRLRIDDGFVGTYRDHPIEIYDLNLWRGNAVFGSHSRRRSGTSTSRLVIRLTLPQPQRSTTAIVDRSSWLEDARSQDETLKPVPITEKPFAELFAVRSTEPDAAMALLGPALRQRLVTFSDASGFAPPMLLIEGRTMLAALRYAGSENLFEPMNLNVDLGQHIAAVDRQLKIVFGMADAMIEIAQGLPS